MNPVEKYNKRVEKTGSLLCVGLDSDISKLPERFLKMEFPQFEFNKWIIDETHEFASSYKPNSAFYEARGDKGITELKMTMEYLTSTHPDIFTINDAKRADIGNTNKGYVESIFDWLGFDAVTINPYLGFEAVSPFLEREDKVSIILCRTSNPGAGEFQDLLVDGNPLWHIVAKKINDKWKEKQNVMMVVGATYPDEMKMIREIAPEVTFLVPGVGAQGGEIKDFLSNGLNKNKKGLIINSSRGIIFKDNPKEEARNLAQEIAVEIDRCTKNSIVI